MSAEREKPMADADVKAWLAANLPALWKLEDGWIRRTYKTASWKGTLMVVNTVGHLAGGGVAPPRYHLLICMGRSAADDAFGEGDHLEGPGTRQEDRGSRALAARQGRQGPGRHAARRYAVRLYQIRLMGQLSRGPIQERIATGAKLSRGRRSEFERHSGARHESLEIALRISRTLFAVSARTSRYRLVNARGLYRDQRLGASRIRTGSSMRCVACRHRSVAAGAAEALSAVENDMGRVRIRHWGPRIIDVDILTIGDRWICGTGSRRSASAYRERAFVLVPLKDVAPNLRINGASLDAMLATLDAGDVVPFEAHR